jgi:type IV pilus assembly protein PilE
MTRQQGFTLIETMAALAVSGIVLAAAVPNFSGHLQKSRRTDAMTALLQAQLAQEDWRSEHASYAADLATLGLGANSAGGHYRLAVASADANGFVLTATAQSGSQRQDGSCAVLRLSVAGGTVSHGVGADLAAPADADPQRCWVR